MSFANILRTLWFKRARSIELRPDPEYRKRRLSQFSPERRARYWRNVEGLL